MAPLEKQPRITQIVRAMRGSGNLLQSFLHYVVNEIRHANRIAPLVVIPPDHFCQIAADDQRLEPAEDG